MHGAGRPAPDVLTDASRLVVLGLNVTSLSRDRKPVSEWKRWQTERQIDLPHPEDDAFLVEQFDGKDVGLGIVTGKASRVVVMDFDDEAAWNEGVERCGGFPITTMSLTGKGRHVYFAHPGGDRRNKTGLDGLRLDVRADGGIVVAPPTWHPKHQRRYRWVDGRSPWDVPFAPMPPELIAWCWPARAEVVPMERVRASTRYIEAALRGEVEAVLGAAKGTRNETLNNAAWSVFRLDGVDPVSASETLLNAALHAGLPEHEAARTISSALEARRGA